MVQWFLFALSFLSLANLVSAQTTIYPSADSVKKEYIQDESFTMKLYAWKDSVKIALGSMEATIEVNKETQQLIYIQKIRLGNFTNDWIDSTVMSLKDLSPIYYSSRKQKFEELVLHFKNNTVKGLWNVVNKTFEIADSAKTAFFDYHFLPVLLCWLPLVEGQTYEIPVYEFIAGKNGMTKISVTKIQTVDMNDKTLMEVTIKENSKNNYHSVFYIDPVEHRVIQVDSRKGDKKTQMVRELPRTL